MVDRTLDPLVQDLRRIGGYGARAADALDAKDAELADLKVGRTCILPKTHEHAQHLYTVARACLYGNDGMKGYEPNPTDAKDAEIHRLKVELKLSRSLAGSQLVEIVRMEAVVKAARELVGTHESTQAAYHALRKALKELENDGN